jgi:hypothetical protein
VHTGSFCHRALSASIPAARLPPRIPSPQPSPARSMAPPSPSPTPISPPRPRIHGAHRGRRPCPLQHRRRRPSNLSHRIRGGRSMAPTGELSLAPFNTRSIAPFTPASSTSLASQAVLLVVMTTSTTPLHHLRLAPLGTSPLPPSTPNPSPLPPSTPDRPRHSPPHPPPPSPPQAILLAATATSTTPLHRLRLAACGLCTTPPSTPLSSPATTPMQRSHLWVHCLLHVRRIEIPPSLRTLR